MISARSLRGWLIISAIGAVVIAMFFALRSLHKNPADIVSAKQSAFHAKLKEDGFRQLDASLFSPEFDPAKIDYAKNNLAYGEILSFDEPYCRQYGETRWLITKHCASMGSGQGGPVICTTGFDPVDDRYITGCFSTVWETVENEWKITSIGAQRMSLDALSTGPPIQLGQDR